MTLECACLEVVGMAGQGYLVPGMGMEHALIAIQRAHNQPINIFKAIHKESKRPFFPRFS